MLDWSDETYDAVARRSHELFRNRHLLPVSAWISECAVTTFIAPDISRGLAGLAPPNKVLEILDRLKQARDLQELPYPGRPHARVFERQDSVLWHLARMLAVEAVTSNALAARDDPT
jgi:hypothetical protein